MIFSCILVSESTQNNENKDNGNFLNKMVLKKVERKYVNIVGYYRMNCHKNGKNSLLFQIIKKAIKLTVIIIEEFHSYLLLSNMLLSRMTPYGDEIIGEYQCRFRRNRSTVDHIFSIRQILEKKWEYNNEEIDRF